jgi:hypothetical protein
LIFFSKNWQSYDKTQESGVGRWLIYQPLADWIPVKQLQMCNMAQVESDNNGACTIGC